MLGHMCEHCRSSDILFPFQEGLVRQCQSCNACYHKKCFEVMTKQKKVCSKCLRIKARRESLARGKWRNAYKLMFYLIWKLFWIWRTFIIDLGCGKFSSQSQSINFRTQTAIYMHFECSFFALASAKEP